MSFIKKIMDFQFLPKKTNMSKLAPQLPGSSSGPITKDKRMNTEERNVIRDYRDHDSRAVKETLDNLTKQQEEKTPNKPKPENETKKVDKAYYRKEFINEFNKLTVAHSPWEAWNDFVVMSACSFSNVFDKSNFEVREKRYLDITKKYGHDEVKKILAKMLALVTLALDDDPDQDFLGSIFMELGLGNHNKGQFFTPDDLCKLMSMLTLDDVVQRVEEEGYIVFGDSCCGAGATLIAGVNEMRRRLAKANLNFQNHVLVRCQDIDETVALMSYIQLSLLGVAGCVKIGDTFTDPMREGDNTEKYWFTPMYFSDIWQTRFLIQRAMKMMGKGAAEYETKEKS